MCNARSSQPPTLLLQRAFISIHAVFRQFDADNSGAIDVDELQSCMKALGAELNSDQVQEMFSYSAMHDINKKKNQALTFKEFLLCLAIGSVLQLFPMLRAYSAVDLRKFATPGSTSVDHDGASSGHNTSSPPSPVSGAGEPRHASADSVEPGLLMQGRHLVNALKLVLEAYILFDTDGSGTIDREEVLAMVDEENRRAKEARKKKGAHGGDVTGTSSLLSRERWEELDWDSDGQITFKEFLFALMTWVGMDDDDDMDELNAADGGAGSGMSNRTGASNPAATHGSAAGGGASGPGSVGITSVSRPGTGASGSGVSAGLPSGHGANGELVQPTHPSTHTATDASVIDDEIDNALKLPMRPRGESSRGMSMRNMVVNSSAQNSSRAMMLTQAKSSPGIVAVPLSSSQSTSILASGRPPIIASPAAAADGQQRDGGGGAVPAATATAAAQRDQTGSAANLRVTTGAQPEQREVDSIVPDAIPVVESADSPTAAGGRDGGIHGILHTDGQHGHGHHHNHQHGTNGKAGVGSMSARSAVAFADPGQGGVVTHTVPAADA